MIRSHLRGFWLALLLAFFLPHAAEARQQNFQWTTLSSLPALPDQPVSLGVAGPFSGISDNALIVAGGANFPQPVWETGKIYFSDIFVLEMDSRGDSTRWLKGNKLERPLGYGASVTTPYGLLCMGGRDAEQVFADVFLLQWDAKQRKITRIDLPPLPKPCAHGYATLIGDKVYLAGGQSGPGLETAMNNLWMLDLSAAGQGDAFSSLRWQELPSWPGPARAVNITVAQHNGIENCVYVISGRRLKDEPDAEHQYDFLRDVYEFSPARYSREKDNTAWRRRADVPTCVMAGTGAPVGQSHIYTFGGDDGALMHRASALREAHPGFPKTAWRYHTITDTWVNAGATPVNQVTTVAVPWDGGFILPSGEVKPRGRTPEVWQAKPVAAARSFGWINFTVLTVYLLGMLLIGFYFMKRSQNTDDYFRGGQRIPWWAVGCSLFSTMLSSITYMSVPAKAYAANWEYFIGYFAIISMAAFVVFLVLPFFRRIDATSAYEYLEKRFNRETRLIGSGLFVVFQIGRMAIVMFLSALALAAITPFSETQAILVMGLLSVIYSTMGGVEAVIWTDTVQTFVLLGGALLILVITIFSIEGGIATFWATATAGQKFHMINWDWDLSSYATPALWVLVLGALAQNLISYTSDQAVVQRYMATSSEKLAARSIWTNGILSIGAGLLFFSLGTGLYVFYKMHPAHLDPMMKTDAIMPLFIIQELPVGLAGLVVAGIFAAAQSTISTSMNSTATSIVTDFIKPFSPQRKDRDFLKFGRLFTAVIGLLGTGFAVLLATADIKSLLDQFFAFIGLFGGSLGGLFVLGMFTKRATGRGAVVGAIIGASVLYLVQSFTDTHLYLYGFVGVASCFISGYLFSLLPGGHKPDIAGLTIFTIRDK